MIDLEAGSLNYVTGTNKPFKTYGVSPVAQVLSRARALNDAVDMILGPPIVFSETPCDHAIMKYGGVCHFGVKELNLPDSEEAEIQ